MTTSAKPDALLRRLTGRTQFDHPGFSHANRGGTVRDLQPFNARVRELLQFDRPDPSYYIIAVLSALESQPELEAMLEAPLRSYDLTRFTPPPVQISHAAHLVYGLGMDNAFPGIRYRPEIFPPATGFQLTRRGDYLLELSAPPHPTEMVPVREILENGSRILYPEWPEWTGITGGISLPDDSIWTTLHLTAEPTRFPWQAAADYLSDDDQVIRLLEAHTLLTAWSTATPSERIALIAAALVLSTEDLPAR